jgi:flagellar protein FlbD
MIMLTRLSGSAFVLNADLIERLDATPDTVVTLVDGKKYVVAEDMAEVVTLVRGWRGAIIAASSLLGDDAPAPTRAHLATVAAHPTMDGEL